VIVTASPVLTNEIRRFYTALKTKVISELKKREDRRKQKLLSDQQEKKPSEESIVEEIVEVEEEKKNEELASMIEDEMINEDEILDFEEMEKNMKMAQSMSEMRNEDFPAFLTIKRLVFMIDASLGRPFFARNIKNEIIGLDS
jgi:hypothetical protein